MKCFAHELVLLRLRYTFRQSVQYGIGFYLGKLAYHMTLLLEEILRQLRCIKLSENRRSPRQLVQDIFRPQYDYILYILRNALRICTHVHIPYSPVGSLAPTAKKTKRRIAGLE